MPRRPPPLSFWDMAVLGAWIAAQMGKAAIEQFQRSLPEPPTRRETVLRLVASNGHRLDHPVSVMRIRYD